MTLSQVEISAPGTWPQPSRKAAPDIWRRIETAVEMGFAGIETTICTCIDMVEDETALDHSGELFSPHFSAG